MNLFDVLMEMRDVYIYIYIYIYKVEKKISVKYWKKKINFINLFGYVVRK